MAFLKHGTMARMALLIALFIGLAPLLSARFIDMMGQGNYFFGPGDPSNQEIRDFRYARWGSNYWESWSWADSPLPIPLKYGFQQHKSPVPGLSQDDIENAFARAFAKWSSVIEVTFEKTDKVYEEADIEIRWQFEAGQSAGLVHANFPPLGILWLNAHAKWAVDDSKDAFDLESVALHAIGHSLGLDHARSKKAVMNPEILPGIKRRDLTVDDMILAKQFYVLKPEYHYVESLGPHFPKEYQYPSHAPPGKYHPPDYHFHAPPLEYHNHESYGSSPAPSQPSSGVSRIVKDSNSWFLALLLLAAAMIIV